MGLLRREGAAALARPFSAARLRRSASFHHLTGISVATFDRMLSRLRAPWEAPERRKAKSGRRREISGLEDHLLVLLLYYRCCVTQEFLGFFYRVDRSAVCRAIRRTEAQVKPSSRCAARRRSAGARPRPVRGSAPNHRLHRAADPAAEGRCHATDALLGQEEAPHPEDRVCRRGRHRAHRQRLRLPPRQPS
jgi:hypothetical protein